MSLFGCVSWVNLIKGKRVSIQDVIKSVVGIEAGLSKAGNHDASPRSTRHYVSTLTRQEHRYMENDQHRFQTRVCRHVYLCSYRVLWVFMWGRSCTPSFWQCSIILWAFLFTMSRSTTRAGVHKDERVSSFILTELEHTHQLNSCAWLANKLQSGWHCIANDIMGNLKSHLGHVKYEFFWTPLDPIWNQFQTSLLSDSLNIKTPH